MNDWFRRVAMKISQTMGSAWAFIIAIVATLIWLASGPMMGFNDGWNFLANTTTTIITFLMVFLIQNTQNRDMKAIHLKLDELIRAHKGARNSLIELEDLKDEELERLHQEFLEICQRRGVDIEGIRPRSDIDLGETVREIEREIKTRK